MSRVFGSDFLFWTAITFFRPYLQRMAMGVPEGFELNAEDNITVRRMLTQVLPVKPRAAGMIFDSYVSNPDINTGYPFARIEVPTLVVSAQDDPMALYTHARTLAQLIPGATLLTLTCGGHLMLGQAEYTGPAIRKFLRQHMAL